MARIRTIKPEFWSSPDTAACEDPWARLLFIAMWNLADDNGRGTANPKELAGDVFPNDEKIDSADIRRMLGGIRRAFGVEFYRIGGRPYFAIPSWDKHQKIDKRGVGKYPAPDEGEPWDPDPDGSSDQQRSSTSRNSTEDSGEPAECPPSTRREPGAGTGEQGNRGTGEEGSTAIADAIAPSPAPPSRPRDPAGFDAFWQACPRKIGKDAARKSFARSTKRSDVTAADIVAAMERAAIFWRRTRTETRFIPHPATWLNQGRYEDPEPPSEVQVARDQNGGLGSGTAAKRAAAILALKRGANAG